MILQERTLMEHKKLVDKILKRDQKRRKRIEAAGIEYECPEIVSSKPFFFLGIYLTINSTRIRSLLLHF